MIVTYFLIDNIRVNWYFKKTLGFILFNEVTWLENHCLACQRSVAHPDYGVKRKHCVLIQFVCIYITVFSNDILTLLFAQQQQLFFVKLYLV